MRNITRITSIALLGAMAAFGFAIEVRVDQKPVSFPAGQPFETKGRVLVPIRGVFEHLGATVEYDNSAQMVTINRGQDTYKLKVGEDVALKNQDTLLMGTKTILREATVYVPLRFLAESLNADVEWIGAERLVNVNRRVEIPPFAIPVPQSGEKGDYQPTIFGKPFLLIERVEQVDNLDQGDWLGKNRADFYALVTVNGRQTKTKVLSKDDGFPYWEVPLDYTKRYSRVSINLMEEDGGLERRDDNADINPKGHRKDLSFTYDRYTGRISGEVKGRLNQVIRSHGGGDDDVCRITFQVKKV